MLKSAFRRGFGACTGQTTQSPRCISREGMLRIEPDDAVVLAVPPDICNDIWPAAKAPTDSRTIVNAHYRMDKPVSLPWDAPFVGLVGS